MRAAEQHAQLGVRRAQVVRRVRDEARAAAAAALALALGREVQRELAERELRERGQRRARGVARALGVCGACCVELITL